MRSVKDDVENRVRYQVWDQVRGQVGNPVLVPIWAPVAGRIRQEVKDHA